MAFVGWKIILLVPQQRGAQGGPSQLRDDAQGPEKERHHQKCPDVEDVPSLKGRVPQGRVSRDMSIPLKDEKKPTPIRVWVNYRCPKMHPW